VHPKDLFKGYWPFGLYHFTKSIFSEKTVPFEISS
jgi:hypothetical protein